jgi:hypothetical protein
MNRALLCDSRCFGITTTSLRVRADQVLGWSRLVHRLPAPCPYCDTLTLVRDDGKDFVRCTGCRRNWRETEYRLFVKMLIEGAQA